MYYSSARQGQLKEPGRILWYVTSDKDGGYREVSAIRACSIIEEVVVGKPKDLYRQNRRLGVYEWNDVLKVAKQDLRREIMAIRFSGTELLRSPIPRKRVYQVLQQEAPLQSPRLIKEDKFNQLYVMGKQ